MVGSAARSENRQMDLAPDWNVFKGNCALPVLVYDCNGDGLNDVIIGAAQDYGLKWVEQKKDSAGKRTFAEHWIEPNFSLFHTMELGDLRGDGKKELVTGKILFPHQAGTPGCSIRRSPSGTTSGAAGRSPYSLVQPHAVVSGSHG